MLQIWERIDPVVLDSAVFFTNILVQIGVLVVNYGISNTIVLEIP